MYVCGNSMYAPSPSRLSRSERSGVRSVAERASEQSAGPLAGACFIVGAAGLCVAVHWTKPSTEIFTRVRLTLTAYLMGVFRKARSEGPRLGAVRSLAESKSRPIKLKQAKRFHLFCCSTNREFAGGYRL